MSKFLHSSSTFYYEIPTSFQKRAASFGYGSKSDFTRDVGSKLYLDNPPPTAYNLPTDLSSKRKSYSFGLSREACEKRAIEGHLKCDPSVPGPGTYNYVKPIGSDSSKFSLRPKTTSLDDLFVVSKNPGPGTYNPKSSIDKKGSYFLSQHKNACAASFSARTSTRFKAFSRNSNPGPGPGTYDNNEGISREGFYFLTKYRSSGVRSFALSSRDFFGLNRETGNL